jgi:hypothetical protein
LAWAVRAALLKPLFPTLVTKLHVCVRGQAIDGAWYERLSAVHTACALTRELRTAPELGSLLSALGLWQAAGMLTRAMTLKLCAVLVLWACGKDPAAEPAASPAATNSKPAAATPPAPSMQAPAQAQDANNPCAQPTPLTLELEAGVVTETPWGLTITFALEEGERGRSSFVFLLSHQGRRWESRRNPGNWNGEMTWRGFCWRGADRPEPRASRVKIDIAPVCKDGKLVELGGCGDTLKR